MSLLIKRDILCAYTLRNLLPTPLSHLTYADPPTHVFVEWIEDSSCNGRNNVE